MTVKVAREFQGKWECFWATTYEFDPGLFEEYLLRRLGEPPLNATVLVDFRQLSALFEDEVEAAQVARRANRDYLLRGISLGGAFHPKTYLFGNEQGGVLLVGSGNLTMPGIEEGHEVFVRFDSQRPAELDSIRGWRDWLERIVEQLGDREVRYRWLDLRRRLPWLMGVGGPGQFVSNLDRPLGDALCEGIQAPVDALHVLAPYYDRSAEALAVLLQRLRPRSLHLYFGARTSVDGKALVKKVKAAKSTTHVYSYEPGDHIHAKLLAVTYGRRGRLLTGSANLSRAALASSPLQDGWSNVEAGVVLDGGSQEVCEIFRSSGLEIIASSLDSVAALKFLSTSGASNFPLRLRVARLLDDDRVEVEFDGDTAEIVFATAGLKPEHVSGGRTARQLMRPEGAGLVWLCTNDGRELSNRVPLDEPARLRSWLEERHTGTDRPPELDASDMSTPVGRMLGRLNDSCIFDVDETPAASRVRTKGDIPDGQAESWEFLEPLLKEELRFDSRLDRYRSSPTMQGLLPEDDVLLLLRAMLDRVSAPWALKAVGDEEQRDAEESTGKSWTPERRLQVRLFNVLERWCVALADQRLLWIDPAAPVRNYAALLVALTECWQQHYLREDRVIELLEVLFTHFIADESGPGFLARLTTGERAAALARLPDDARFLAAALAYAVLRPMTWAEHIFQWQPLVAAAREMDVMLADQRGVAVIRALTGEEVTWEQADERLEWAGAFMDDDHWATKQERDLGLEHVEVVKDAKYAGAFGSILKVRGASLDTASMVPLLRRALSYKKTSGAIILFDESAKLSVRLGDIAYAAANGRVFESREVITDSLLASMERNGSTWGQLLDETNAAAS